MPIDSNVTRSTRQALKNLNHQISPVNTSLTATKSTESEESRPLKTAKQSIAIVVGAWLALIISLTTLCLTLLGYGYDLAYLDATGLRSEELQRTPIDFLLRSWRPLTDCLIALTKMLTLDCQRKLWIHLLWKMWWFLLLLPLASALIACLAHYKPWRYGDLDTWRTAPWVVKVELALEPASNRFKQWQSYKVRRWGMTGWLVGPAIFGIFTAAVIMLLGIAIAVIVLIAGLPALGTSFGKERARHEVLTPLGCIGQKLAPGQDAERQARCVKVFRDGLEIARGYVIDFGAGRIFLYQPCTRSVISTSLERTVIEQVDSLGFATLGKNCRSKINTP